MLPVNARVAIASRNPPSPAWRTAPGWQGLFRSLPLEPLSEMEAMAYLAMNGVEPEVARRINRLARGHPLALGMAISIVLSEAERTIEETAAPGDRRAVPLVYRSGSGRPDATSP